jgi:hypothetical protein
VGHVGGSLRHRGDSDGSANVGNTNNRLVVEPHRQFDEIAAETEYTSLVNNVYADGELTDIRGYVTIVQSMVVDKPYRKKEIVSQTTSSKDSRETETLKIGCQVLPINPVPKTILR